MCSNVRVLTAAIAGYLIGGLTGSALASWLLMVAAGGAMFAWSRASDRRNGGASCAIPPAGRRGPAVRPVSDEGLHLIDRTSTPSKESTSTARGLGRQ